MTLPSEHHGAIFAQAPRPVHRTLVRGSRAYLQGHARGTRIAHPRRVVRGGEERGLAPTSPRPSKPSGFERKSEAGATCVPVRPSAFEKKSKVGAACVPPSAFGGGGQGEVGLAVPCPRAGTSRTHRAPALAEEDRTTRCTYRRRTSAQESASCPAVNS